MQKLSALYSSELSKCTKNANESDKPAGLKGQDEDDFSDYANLQYV